MSESGRKNQNWAAELSIGNLRRKWRKQKQEDGVPERLWDYAFVHNAKLSRFLPNGPGGRTLFETTHGYTPDISEYADFSFYDLVWYYDPTEKNNTDKLGRWIGVADKIGNDLTYWIITGGKKVIPSSTFQHVTQADLRNPDIQARVKKFNDELNTALDAKAKDIIKEKDIPMTKIEDSQSLHEVNLQQRLNLVTPRDDEYGDMLQEERKRH